MKSINCPSLRIAALLLPVFCVSVPVHAGDQISLGVAFAATTPSGVDVGKHLGPGGLVSLFYTPWNRLAVTLSSGYLTWRYADVTYISKDKYNTHVVPIILGARYFFTDEGLRPYFSGELEYSIGKHDYTVSLPTPMYPPGSEYSGTTDISEIGSGLGLGFQLPLSQNLKFDLGASVLLTSQAQSMPNFRILAGVVFGI